jgi:DNA-directed RNA polymerase subunit beta'
MVVVDKKGKPIQIPGGGEARYALSVDAILSVEDGAEVKAGDVIARIPTEGAKTRDITGGLPRVAELFEARKPKEAAVLAETDGFVEFGKDYKNKRRVIVKPKSDKIEPTEYLIPKGKHISVREGDYVEKGDYIVEGNPSPHDILRIKGMEELATYLVKEIQDVYRLQGVKINDKHIEVICRQMMQKLEITEGGETTLLAGEQVDQLELDEANQKAIDVGGKIAEGRPVLLGITKASLQTRSVFSAASFQETTRVLTDAAVNGKVDTLEGLKENVIVGRLIPAGTGGAIARLRHIATERDRAIQEEQASNAPVAQIEGPVAAE